MKFENISYSLTNPHSGYSKNFNTLDALKNELERLGLPAHLAMFPINPNDIRGQYVTCTNNYQIWQTVAVGNVKEG